MSKQIFFLAAFLLSLSSFSQSIENKPDYIRKQVNVNAFMDYYGYNTRSYGIGGAFGFNNWLEAGAYCSFMKRTTMNEKMFMLNYGLDAKIHIVSAFAPSFFVVDPYLTARVGARSVYGDSDSRTMFNYNVGGGVAVNFSRHCGLFYELYYDNIMHNSVNRFGVNIRFGESKK